MRKAQFSLDIISEVLGSDIVFSGYTAGDDWNGWATPFFTKEEADRLVVALNATYDAMPTYAVMFGVGGDNPAASYDAVNDTFVTFNENEMDEPDVWLPSVVEVDGVAMTLYAIGAYNWTWSEVDDCEWASNAWEVDQER